MTTIKNNTQYNNKIKTLENTQEKLYDLAQETIEYFVQEYNQKLCYNKESFTRILKCLDNNAKTMFKFLKKYTNITFISNDFKDFKTDVKTEITTKSGEKITVYTLRFKDEWTGQKWFENIDEDTQETIKQLTNKGLKAKLSNLLNTLQGNSKTENKVNINTKELETVCKNYIARLEQAEAVAKA